MPVLCRLIDASAVCSIRRIFKSSPPLSLARNPSPRKPVSKGAARRGAGQPAERLSSGLALGPEYGGQCNRGGLRRAVLAVAGVVLMSTAHAAWAQPPAQQLTPPGTAPSDSAQPAYCKQSTLTGPKFLDLLHAIIKHGDLTDITFLQNTLGTKFSFTYGKKPDGAQDSNSLFYTSDQIMENPIPVTVSIFKGKKAQEAAGEIASVRFEPVSQDIFIKCLKLTAANFVSLFGRETGGGSGGPLSIGGGVIETKNRGTNGTKLKILFGYNYYLSGRPTLPHELVTNVMIKETP